MGTDSVTTVSASPGTHGHQRTLMTTTEVCTLTGLDVEELRNRWQVDTAPARIRIGRTVVYGRGDVLAWMRSAGVQPTSGPRLATGPVQCVPWCSYDDDRGHPDRLFEEDQWCGSERLTVALSRHREVDVDGLHMSAVRRPGEAPVITVDIGEAYGTELTLSEAGQLTESLQLLLGMVGTSEVAR